MHCVTKLCVCVCACKSVQIQYCVYLTESQFMYNQYTRDAEDGEERRGEERRGEERRGEERTRMCRCVDV